MERQREVPPYTARLQIWYTAVVYNANPRAVSASRTNLSSPHRSPSSPPSYRKQKAVHVAAGPQDAVSPAAGRKGPPSRSHNCENAQSDRDQGAVGWGNGSPSPSRITFTFTIATAERQDARQPASKHQECAALVASRHFRDSSPFRAWR